MKSPFVFVLLFSFLFPSLFAQWKIQEAGVRLEGFSETDNSNIAPDISELSSLYPWSNIAQGDLSDYQKNYGYGSFSPKTHLFVALSKDYWEYTTLRIGLFYGNAFATTASYKREDHIVIDTLMSSSSNRSVTVDSVNARSVNVDQRHQELGVNAELLFYLYPEKRWSLYGGVGFMAGVHINNRIDVVHSETIWERVNFGDRSVSQWQERNTLGRDQQAIDGLGYHISANIPVGLDFTVSKNESSTWNNVHLFWEWRPMFMYRNLSSGNDMLSVGIATGLGVRVHW